jgi:putative addiction module component (TIGR02574 family)
MSENVEAIFSAALALPPDTRAALAEKLLESLHEQDQGDIDAAWAAEAQRRLAAFDRGEIKGTPAEEVMRSLRIRNTP